MFIDINAKSALEYLADLDGKLADPAPLLADIADILADAIEENFEKEGRPEKWADLSENTKAKRRKSGKWPGKILQRTQAGLASSITARSDSEEAAAGTNKIYAATMNFGAKKGEFGETKTGLPIPFGDIPARSFMSLAENDIEEIRETAIDYLSP